MATINFSKIKKDNSTAVPVNPIKIDLVKVEEANKEEVSTPSIDTSNVENKKDFTLSFSPKVTYDLDEMIESKRRDNSDMELILHTNLSEEYLDRLIVIVTKKILDDYKIAYSNDESSDRYFKKVVNEVIGFEMVFNKYFGRYYSMYLAEISNDNLEGSISIDTIFRKFEVTNEDIKKYLIPEYSQSIKAEPKRHAPRTFVAKKASDLRDATDYEKKYATINLVIGDETIKTEEINESLTTYAGYSSKRNLDGSYSFVAEMDTTYKLPDGSYSLNSGSIEEANRVSSFEN